MEHAQNGGDGVKGKYTLRVMFAWCWENGSISKVPAMKARWSEFRFSHPHKSWAECLTSATPSLGEWKKTESWSSLANCIANERVLNSVRDPISKPKGGREGGRKRRKMGEKKAEGKESSAYLWLPHFVTCIHMCTYSNRSDINICTNRKKYFIDK